MAARHLVHTVDDVVLTLSTTGQLRTFAVESDGALVEMEPNRALQAALQRGQGQEIPASEWPQVEPLWRRWRDV